MENYSKFKEVLSISNYSKVRKHKQIINSVLDATSMGSLRLNDKLPSVNELSIDCNISRDTVVRAYAFLKENDIIDSVPGKGYYVKSINNEYKAKVFLLFNTLSPHMKKIYDVFAEALQETAVIDFYICENNYHQFKKHILFSNSKEYSHYVIAANFDEEGEDCMDFIRNEVPVEKLILLNKKADSLGDEMVCVCQDFEIDIFLALEELAPLLKKYEGIKLILPKNSNLPEEIKNGFIKFCNQYQYDFDLIEDLNSEVIEKHTAYIDFEDDESLVNLIKKMNKTDLIIGKDIGIVSYNDNPLKELLLGGITVVSNVFEKIGYQAADLILKKESKQSLHSFKIIVRESL